MALKYEFSTNQSYQTNVPRVLKLLNRLPIKGALADRLINAGELGLVSIKDRYNKSRPHIGAGRLIGSHAVLIDAARLIQVLR